MKRLHFIAVLIILTVPIKAQLSNGLISYWSLDETTGSTASDAAADNDGTITGATIGQTGKIGNAYSFDGINDYISFTDNEIWSINTTSSLSVSAWIYLTGDIETSEYACIWGYQWGPQLYIRKSSAGNYNIGWFAGNTVKQTSAISFALNTWYHIVLTKNGSTLKFYRNNNDLGTYTAIDNNVDPPNIFIGGDTENEQFKGKIDEVCVWSSALSIPEVSALYNGGNGLSYSNIIGGPSQYTLTTASSPATGGTVSLSPTGGIYDAGITVTATASANGGYIFTGWSGDVSITDNPVSITLDANKTLTANFTETTADYLTVSSASLSYGSSSNNQNISVSSNISWTVTDDQSWITVNPESGSNDEQLTVAVTENTATESRSGTVTISGGGITRTVSITQSGVSASSVWDQSGNNIFYNSGKVSIGTSIANSESALTVEGKILATEIQVVSEIVSDFVFETGYDLMSLPEVEIFIKKNKHLPGIPSASEFAKSGQNLAKTDDLLLRKIEELTLYIISLEKRIGILECEQKSNINTDCQNKFNNLED